MKILVVDDDPAFIDLVRHILSRDGFEIVSAPDGSNALELFDTQAPDLVILDLMIPKRSGMDVLREIRRQSRCPVIVLSAKSDEDAVVGALDIDADDYIVKPFRVREFRARVRMVLRRGMAIAQAGIRTGRPLECGTIVMDPAGRGVTVDGMEVRLTRREFAMLHLLMTNKNRVIASSAIVAAVWGFDADVDEETVKAVVFRLRRKIEADPSRPRHLLNVYGSGYVLKEGRAD